MKIRPMLSRYRAIIVIVIAATTMLSLQCDDNTARRSTALRPEAQGVARAQ